MTYKDKNRAYNLPQYLTKKFIHLMVVTCIGKIFSSNLLFLKRKKKGREKNLYWWLIYHHVTDTQTSIKH